MKGPGTKSQQIQSLRDKVGAAGVKNVDTIVKDYSPSEIALAYRLSRRSTALPKSVTNLLGNLPEGEAKAIRDKLLAAKG